MFLEFITLSLGSVLFFALHVINGNSFKSPLSSSEELECLQKIQEGDKKSKDKLIEHNLRLVAHIIKKYYNTNYEQEDLISIGTIGLIKAVNSFKLDKNIKFSTYASRCIENEILMYFRSQKKTLYNAHIDDPIDMDKNGNPLTLLDIIADTVNIEENVETKIRAERAKLLIIESLSPRERLIIEMRFGLNGFHPKTQREIADNLLISRSYVSRIEKKALATLEKKF